MVDARDPELDRLYSQLTGPDPDLRKKAIFALLRKKDAGCVDLLQELAFKDADVEVRYYAAKAMNFLSQGQDRPKPSADPKQDMTPTEAVTALKSPDPEIRLRAVQVLARSQDPGHLPAILDLAKNETDPLVRSALPLAMSILGSADQIEIIVQKFIQDPNSRVRANAIEALGLIGDKRAYPYIIGFLQDRDNRVRTNAVLALNKFGKVNLVQTLQEMLYQPQVWMRDSAAFALQLIKSAEAIPLLETAIQDSYQGVRIKAKKALQGLVKKGVTEAQAVLDRYAHVTEEESLEDFLKLAEALEGDSTGSDQQKRVAETSQPQEEYEFKALEKDKRITEVLRAAKNQDLAVAPKLLEFLDGENDKKVRATLISALGRLKYRPAMDKLIECLSERDSRVRANAVEALAQFQDDKAYAKIMPMLKDANNRVLANAILALDPYPYVNAIQYLEKLVISRKAEYRASALYICSTLRTLDTLPVLERLLSDVDIELRAKARQLLKELASDEGNFRARSVAKEYGVTF